MSPEKMESPAHLGVLERIDPARQTGPLALDHALRYHWVAQLVRGKRVLDAATGTGFGAVILAEAGAREVLAVDVDAPALETAARTYPHPQVRYQVFDLQAGDYASLGGFDLVVSFETLEHLQQPERALAGFRQVLGEAGLLVLSVPGPGDAEEDNPYHHQHFQPEALSALVGPYFPWQQAWRQDFFLGSIIRPATAPSPGVAVEGLDTAGGPHSQLLLASGQEPEQALTSGLLASCARWDEVARERREVYAATHKFARLYTETHAAYTDLIAKFEGLMAWGRYLRRAVEGGEGDLAEAHRNLRLDLKRLLQGQVPSRAPATTRPPRVEADMAVPEDLRPVYQLGREVFGPLIALFVHEVAVYARRTGADQVYFLARDGALLIQLYERFAPAPPPASYLRVDRRMAVEATQDAEGRSRLEAYLREQGFFGVERQQLLVDTGWKGTIPWHLAAAFAEREDYPTVDVLYLGRSYTPHLDFSRWARTTVQPGLLYDERRLVAAEHALGRVTPLMELLTAEVAPEDPQAPRLRALQAGILAAGEDFLRTYSAHPGEAHAWRTQAVARAARLILNPTRQEALLLAPLRQTQDFGGPGDIVFAHPEVCWRSLLRPGRFQAALRASAWKEGALAAAGIPFPRLFNPRRAWGARLRG